ncbi:hypothetical protein FRC06_002755 [Ceratobasidium sp. 370]|nr:hypothetical protein FRC06_002755 [Ceratobasidium sp. 370]
MHNSLSDFESSLQLLGVLRHKIRTGQPVAPEWAWSNLSGMLIPILSLLSDLTDARITLSMLPKNGAGGHIAHHIYASGDMAEFFRGDQGKTWVNAIERWVSLAQKPVPLETQKFSGNAVGKLFGPDVVPLVKTMAVRYVPELLDALTNVQEYEKLGPPQADKDILLRWKSGIVGDTPLLPSAPLDSHSEKAWILHGLPEEYVQIACNAHSFSSPGFLLYWLNTQPFLDPHTRLLLGGFHGAAFGIKLIARMLIALYTAEQSSSHHFTIMLSSQVDSSLRILRDQRHSHMVTPLVNFSAAQHDIPSWQHLGEHDG